MYYLVGHGLSLSGSSRYSFRAKLPGEDLLLGYQMSIDGVEPCLSAGFDVCEAVSDLKSFIAQNERWFLGEITALLEVARSGRGLRLIIRRSAGIIFWLTGPLCIIGSGIFLYARRPRLGLGMLTLVGTARLGLTLTFQSLLNASGVGEHGLPANPVGVVGLLIKPVIGSLSGWRACVRLVFSPKTILRLVGVVRD